MSAKKQRNGNGNHVVANRVLGILKSRPAKIGELERALNKSKKSINEGLEYLRSRGHRIVHRPVSGLYFLEQSVRARFDAVTKEVLYTNDIVRKLGMSETHIGGRHSQPHFVAILCNGVKTGEYGKIDGIDHYGDVFNGLKHPDYNRGGNILNTSDLQIEAGIRVFSCLEELPVFIRPGDHDMWQHTASGTNMVANMINQLNSIRRSEGKTANFYYVSSDENDQVVFKGFIFEYKHIMSAQSRGLTTKAQYMFEDRIGDFVKLLQLNGRKKNKSSGLAQPDHIGFGNWHREISMFHGGTAMDLYPGFQESTDWEKNMGVVHKFGAKIVTLSKDKDGNVFRYDIRYLDLSDQIEKITSKDFGESLLAIALKHFDKYTKQFAGVKPEAAKK